MHMILITGMKEDNQKIIIDTKIQRTVEFHINNSHINNIFAAYQNFVT